MRWVRDYIPQQAGQSKLYREALIITLGGNIVLAISKAIVAYLSGSVALYSDAANSVSDVVYSLLMVLGLWMAQRPPDISHPQGHSRFEPLIGLVVTASMAFAGFEAARASINRFIEGGMAVMPIVGRLRVLRSWGGIMDMSMDGSPIIDKTSIDGLYLNAGWCYGGFKATPAAGLTFAHLIARDEPHDTARAYRLDRFATGRMIDEKGMGNQPNLH